MKAKALAKACLLVICLILEGCLMGTATPPPPVVGATCPVCDGVLWPAGQTPRFIHVHFWEIVQCPLIPQEPPDGIWVLEQTAEDACRWEFTDGEYGFVVDIEDLGVVTAQGLLCNGALYFFYANFVPCQSIYDNEQTICVPPYAGILGTCEIQWW